MRLGDRGSFIAEGTVEEGGAENGVDCLQHDPAVGLQVSMRVSRNSGERQRLPETLSAKREENGWRADSGDVFKAAGRRPGFNPRTRKSQHHELLDATSCRGNCTKQRQDGTTYRDKHRAHERPPFFLKDSVKQPACQAKSERGGSSSSEENRAATGDPHPPSHSTS